MTDSSPSGGSGQRSERLDSIFLVLADEDRRRVLQYFMRHEECVASVEDIIEFAIEADGDDLTADELERRYHHFTLPKLVEHGVIEFDHRSRTVRYRGPDAFEEILRVVEKADLRAE